jgi:hypothetical protein
MTAFLTVFDPTPEKTRHYLTAFSRPDPSRIRFLVERDNRPVGHIGLCNTAADGAEIDNVMRGEPDAATARRLWRRVSARPRSMRRRRQS